MWLPNSTFVVSVAVVSGRTQIVLCFAPCGQIPDDRKHVPKSGVQPNENRSVKVTSNSRSVK